MDIYLLGLIAGFAAAHGAAHYFLARAGLAAKEGELKFGLFVKGLGLVALLFSLAFLVMLITKNYEVNKPGETTALIGLIVGVGVPAIYLLTDCFFVKGSYNEESISFKTPWTGTKNEKWEDLQSVKFNGWCDWHVLRFKSGRTVRLSSSLGGVDYLLENLRGRGYDF